MFVEELTALSKLLPRQARAYERVGTRLAALPLLRAAFSRGELSYAKVAALVTVAEPATEQALLELAEVLTASQLARCLAAYRRVTTAEAAQAQREFLDCFWSDDGWLELRGRLAADEGALFLRALQAARDALWQRRRADPPPRPAEPLGPFADTVRVTNAEALAAVADLALAGPETERSGGERYQLVVHVDQPTLRADAPGRCQLDDGPPLAVETARRLACDASARARPQTPHRLHAAPPRPARTRPRLPLPRLRPQPLRRRPPHPPLEQRRRHQPRQPDPPLPPPPPPPPRTRLHAQPRPRRHNPLPQPTRDRDPQPAAKAAAIRPTRPPPPTTAPRPRIRRRHLQERPRRPPRPRPHRRRDHPDRRLNPS
jgi:hypothetical protein